VHTPVRHLILSLLIAGGVAGQAASNELTLWYAQPAAKWTEALPIGNGRLGAMIFGGTANERIQFNEDTLWRGKPQDYVRAGALDHLAEIRRLIFEGQADEAGKLARETAISDPVRQMPYQPFGDLRLHFPGHENVTDYRRELDLDSAIAGVSYRLGEVQFVRTAFASHPDRAIELKFMATQPGQINFTLTMDSPHPDSQTRAIAAETIARDVTAGTLAMTGRVQADGLRFESRVRVIAFGGTLATNDNIITVANADSATVFLVAATSFKNFQDISADPAQRCENDLARLGRRKFAAVLADHCSDHRSLFRRVSLKLAADLLDRPAANPVRLPTNERLARLKTSGLETDPGLAALHFQYGRYLLIASSRPGTQPANLQGVWNEELNPPWESKYTLNINAEMNYWPAEVCNLSECHEPLFDLIDDLTITGARTARQQYGARGWVVHHNTDLWRGAAPINNVDGFWPTGGAWLCHHLWEHYLFTGDQKFLQQRAYPAMKSAAQFFADFLIKDPKTGYLVTSPSHSPEQTPPHRPLFTVGPTMDNQLIRALFTHTIQAAEILGTDQKFAKQLAELRAQLPPNRVGQRGQLREWLEDWDLPDNNHRHMSPLWGLYPGGDITPADARIWDAAKVLLQWRGDGSTGWSYAWRMPLWARVGDGDFAFRQFQGLLQKRTLPNLFDLCGPFQIDGNFGACAGLAEMLLQSHLTEVRSPKSEVRILDLLPALPKAWPNGAVTGLCARGGFEVDLAWRNDALTQATIRSRRGEACRVRYGSRHLDLSTKPGGAYVLDSGLKLMNR
jgi:alpha-L-fucosidase 2